MKKITFVIAIAIFCFSCQNATKKSSEKESVGSANEKSEQLFTVDEIQEKGYELVGREVIVSGTVSHVCKHSGQRCFLMGSNENNTIRVEAGSKIGSFTQDQMGSDLKVKGILQEIRIDDEYVNEMEVEANVGNSANKEHALGHDEEGNHEVDGGNHGGGQMKKISELREKIKSSHKGYTSIFYMDGEKYETVN